MLDPGCLVCTLVERTKAEKDDIAESIAVGFAAGVVCGRAHANATQGMCEEHAPPVAMLVEGLQAFGDAVVRRIREQAQSRVDGKGH